jgi:hypothetical protein
MSSPRLVCTSIKMVRSSGKMRVLYLYVISSFVSAPLILLEHLPFLWRRFLQEVFEKTWTTKPSLRKNTLIIRRTPKIAPAPPPALAPAPSAPPDEAPPTSEPSEMVEALSATPVPEATVHEPPLLSREELADLPNERLIQLTESRMKIWNGPSSEGWMPPPRVSRLRVTPL